MSTVDPTGRLVVLTRDGPTVSAITSRVRGGEKAPGDQPPYAVVVPLVHVPHLGVGNGRRARINSWRHAIRCYGPKTQGGDRQAQALALAVETDLDMVGPITFPAPSGGSGNAGVYQLQVESSIGPVLDPVTTEPYCVVTTLMAATARSF